MVTFFFGGILAGLAIAVPVGAVATIIVLTSASRGWRIGAAAGLGAATVDGIYATVAVALGAVIAPLVLAIETPLRWISAAVLVLVGALLIRGAFQPRSSEPSTVFATPGRAYLTVLGLTLVNPATIVYFAALVVGSPFGRIDSGGEGVAFVLGALLASAAWQVLLASGGSLLGRVLSGPTGRRWTAVLGGAVVILLGLKTLLLP